MVSMYYSPKITKRHKVRGVLAHDYRKIELIAL